MKLYLLPATYIHIILATMPELQIDLEVSEIDFVNKIIDLDTVLELTFKDHEDKLHVIFNAMSQKIDYYTNTPVNDLFPNNIIENDNKKYFLRLTMKYCMKKYYIKLKRVKNN